ncbi:hypothetical protein PC117_g17304 [Phytophthora cactorum]|uniref:ABC transporter domain-containing protein n=1 Tax=Phytophthora cactorum TaxID=29920 RepID=A0A8T1CA43_9STRA|nr:hypothetical protein PC117_g17304 [Phytophthora cactorum]
MAGLWSSVGVLLWKNWRVKQRESRFNRGRLGKRWLYPALVTDIIIPLGLVLLLIQKMCEYNAQLVTPGGGIPGFGGMRHAMDVESDGNLLQTERGMMAQDEGDITEELTNQSLAILQRQDSQLFLQYLNREYPAATELGISSYVDKTKIIPFNNTASNEEANRVILEFPMKSGWNIYAGLDVRRAEAESEDDVSLPLELLALFYQKTLNDPSDQESEDQLSKFFSKDLTFNRTMLFPDIMPFQMSLDMFIRGNTTSFVNNEIVDLNSLSPEIICQAVDKMLDVANLQWGDFPATSPLGRSVPACKIAVKKGGLSAELRYFLANLITKAISGDELDTLTVSALPKRPANTVAGPLEGNIVFYLAYLFLWPYVRLVRDVVSEKEKQLKEYLMIMGLPAMSLLISWFLLYFFASAVVSLIGTWLLSGSMFAATTDGSVYFFLLLVTFVSSMLLFGLAITPIFTQTKTAAACAPLIYFVMSAGTFIRSLVGDDVVASNESLALLLVVLDGISSPVVFMATMHDILAFDAVTLAHRSITYHTVAEPCRLMATQSAGYLLLGWYLENVFPRTYGVQQKWYFVFQPSYWFPTKVNLQGSEEENEESMRLTDMGRDNIDEQMDDTLREQSLPEYLEQFRPTLFVQSLSKTYPNGKVALNNVSFGVRKGEIFGLLGPNAWADLLMTTLRKYVPNAAIVSDNKWETRVQLNDGEEKRFAELFRELETMKKNGILKRYAIAATDLEDVFVKVTEGEDVYYHAKDDVEDDTTEDSDPVRSKMETEKSKAKMDLRSTGIDRKLPGWKHSMSQLRALIIKRMKMSSRDKKSLFAQYVWPIGFFAILMAVLQHLLDSRGSIETVTTLTPSAKDASFFISSAATMTDSVADLVAQFEQNSHPILFDKSVTTEQDMLDAIARENSTTFFAGIFVSNVNWTADNTIESPVMAYSLYYNETVRRSLPVTLQWISQAYCKARSKHEKSLGIDNCDLVVKRGTFPIEIEIGTGVTTDEEDGVSLDPDEAVNVVRRIMVAFYLLMTMSSVVGFYIAPVVREKESGLKRIQYQHLETANASSLYWLSNFLFDYMVYTSATITICIILAIFSGCLTAEIIAAWFASMAIFGLAILPAQYLSSLVFASHSSAQSYMSYLSLFQIMAASIVFALSMVPGLCAQVNFVTYFLQFLPLYSFSTVVLNIVTVSWAPMRRQCLEVGGDLETGNPFAMLEGLIGQPKVSVWAWEVTGSCWFALVASGVLYTLLLLVMDQYQMYPTLMEHRMRHKLRWVRRFLPCRRRSSQGYTEADQTPAVFDEESPNSEMVHMVRVSQVFNPRKKTPEEQAADSEGTAAVTNESGQVVALNDVSFSVEKRDCVALLGVNGSGKSTMFEILTAGISPTSGKALIDSCDVTVQPREASVRYGYCSQGNHYFNDLSVREHLELFYRLRCSRSNALMSEGAVIDELMRRLDLFPVEKTAASHLSGGNKRRLMLALALLSDHTSLLLLDEPSAGVDVVARRLMWRVLHEKRQSHNRTSCLFTTHSMEEAEAVCANAVVLFKGKVVWCGSIPDLKQRVSRGISISVRLDSASIWDSEQVQQYSKQIRRSIKARPSTSARREGLERNSILLRELEDAWELCHNLFHKNGDAATAAVSRQHGKTWLAGLRSRFESDENESLTPNKGTKAEPVIPIVEFVQEWLLQEAFARLETKLFKDEVTTRSGESVVSADLETARGSGSNTSGVYETSCTDSFGLADVFSLMEVNKQRFHIAQYSVSELSLERVFEQFTG